MKQISLPVTRTILVLLLAALLLYAHGCGSTAQKDSLKNGNTRTEPKMELPATGTVRPFMQPCVVYKTRRMYDSLVSIIVTPDKKDVQSYPAPVDMYRNGSLAYPTRLKDGYLLDNRGVSIHTAFIRLTYAEYAALERAPTVKELLAMIVDDDPITELYVCGERAAYTNIIPQLTYMIESGELARQRRLK
ncbi:MAG: hypothetical protein JNL32_11205 [Candidatus Kapabacteria bacterium]|nr:hypothetical protein [Candidatus Kapabacteria bacterium]